MKTIEYPETNIETIKIILKTKSILNLLDLFFKYNFRDLKAGANKTINKEIKPIRPVQPNNSVYKL